jgi:hypothetical protein
MAKQTEPDRQPERDCPVIEITPEMIEAGVEEAWHGADAPQSVYDLVKRIYDVMDRVRQSAISHL